MQGKWCGKCYKRIKFRAIAAVLCFGGESSEISWMKYSTTATNNMVSSPPPPPSERFRFEKLAGGIFFRTKSMSIDRYRLSSGVIRRTASFWSLLAQCHLERGGMLNSFLSESPELDRSSPRKHPERSIRPPRFGFRGATASPGRCLVDLLAPLRARSTLIRGRRRTTT